MLDHDLEKKHLLFFFSPCFFESLNHLIKGHVHFPEGISKFTVFGKGG